ncbi:MULTISPECIES: hypothetical protein [Bacillaceae]|nr:MULTISPECIES: hypothetical protein [Bacillaceae]
MDESILSENELIAKNHLEEKGCEIVSNMGESSWLLELEFFAPKR